MKINSQYGFLVHVPDQAIFEEAVDRLIRLYAEEYGISLRFGSFEFVIGDGALKAITKPARRKLYSEEESPVRRTLSQHACRASLRAA